MVEAIDPSLARAIESLSLPDIFVGHRLIGPGDESALLEEEARSIESRTAEARRASGAARIVGRRLLARLGYAECAIPKGPSAAPLWPAGLVGSFAHDESVAVAAVAHCCEVGTLGIDVEPAQALPSELLDVIATPQERRHLGSDPWEGRLLFTAKEAVYKAAYTLDGTLLDYHDIAIDLSAGKACAANGRIFELRHCIAAHVVTLAFIVGSCKRA